MKKFSVILLIAVLAMTSVFAGVTGSLTAEYDVDFDAKSFGYAKPSTGLSASFVLDNMTAAKKGEGKAWIDSSVSFKWTAFPKKAAATQYGIGTLGYFTLSIDSVKLCSSSLTVDLTTAKALGDLAKSDLNQVTFKFDDSATKPTKKVVSYDVADTTTGTGATIAWNKGFTFAVAANGAIEKDAKQEYYLGVLTPNFTLGEGFNLQGAGSLKFAGDPKNATKAVPYEWQTNASVKFAFTSDNATVTAATDNQLKFAKGVKATYNVDGDVKAKIFFVDTEVYFAKKATATTPTLSAYTFETVGTTESKTLNSKTGIKKVSYSTTAADEIENLFSAKLAFDFNQFNVPLTLTFTGLDLLNNYRIFNVDAAVDFGFISGTVYGHDLLTVGDTVEGTFHKQNNELQAIGATVDLEFEEIGITAGAYVEGSIGGKTVSAGLSGEYTHAFFDAEAGVDMVFDCSGANLHEVYVSAALASEKLINGATLEVGYDSCNLLKNGANPVTGDGVGAAYAALTVEF